jgi:hemoglobin
MRTRFSIGLTSCVLTLVALSVACAKKEEASADSPAAAAADTTAKPRSLYDRLGGQSAITAVVDSFVAIVAKDARINQKFARSDVARVKRMLVDQVCAQTGGPCTYTGRTMKEAHLNMGVTEGEFNALVEDLVTTLNAFNVPKPEQDELLNALGTMKADIVEVPSSSATGTVLPKNFNPAPAPAKQD